MTSERRVYLRKYYKKNKITISGQRKSRYKKLKDDVYKKLGNRCSSKRCSWINKDKSSGCTDRRCLQIDHRFGDGMIDRGNLSNASFLRKVLKDRKNLYQLLCCNCNWIKRSEEEEGRPSV